MNQRQRAVEIVRDHAVAHRLVESLESLHRRLDALLDEAQNPVAEGGKSDGSLDAREFDRLRMIERSANGLLMRLRGEA